jgi:hypothetical protein
MNNFLKSITSQINNNDLKSALKQQIDLLERESILSVIDFINSGCKAIKQDTMSVTSSHYDPNDNSDESKCKVLLSVILQELGLEKGTRSIFSMAKYFEAGLLFTIESEVRMNDGTIRFIYGIKIPEECVEVFKSFKTTNSLKNKLRLYTFTKSLNRYDETNKVTISDQKVILNKLITHLNPNMNKNQSLIKKSIF